MKTGAVAVLDVGKTNTKVVLLDEELAIVEVHQEPSTSDGAHLDSGRCWTFLRATLAGIASRHDLAAVVPTTHGAAFAILKDRRLAHPVIDYERPVPASVSADYDALRPAFAETFSPGLPLGLNAGRQLYALSRSHSETLRQADAVLPYAQYWAWMLCGEAASEVSSLGCHTDLWAPLARRPSSLCAAMGWDRALAPIKPAWSELGPPLPHLGLPSACRILAGAHDSNAAFLRYLSGASGPFAVVSTGTWFICFNMAGDVAGLDATRDTLANVDVLGRAVASARFMGGRDYAEIAGPAGLGAQAGTAALRAVVFAGSMALPAAEGASGPRYEICGQPRGDAERQALAALTCALMTCETLTLTGSLAEVYVDGPFAGNELYLGALALLLGGTRVLASQVPHGTSVGAALLARWSMTGGVPQHRLAARRVAPLDIDLEAYACRWRAMARGRAGSRGRA